MLHDKPDIFPAASLSVPAPTPATAPASGASPLVLDSTLFPLALAAGIGIALLMPRAQRGRGQAY